MPPHDKICGCQLLIPDTAFFEGGRIKFLAKTDKEDGCLVYYKNKPLLKDLRMIFSEVTRDRKKEIYLTEALVQIVNYEGQSGSKLENYANNGGGVRI